jgi:hypothetical protein
MFVPEGTPRSGLIAMISASSHVVIWREKIFARMHAVILRPPLGISLSGMLWKKLIAPRRNGKCAKVRPAATIVS